MKRIIILLLIDLFSIGFVYSQTIQINTSTNGINIKIVSLSIEKNKISTPNKISIKGVKNKFPSSYYNNKLEEIRLLFALPSLKNYNFNYKIKSIKPIENINNLKLNKSYRPEIKLMHIGFLRGIPIAELIIRPYKYNLEGNELSIVSSADINLDFNRNLNLSKFINNSPDDALFDNVINKTQLNSLKKLFAKTKKYNNRTQVDNNWYNPNRNYLKIMTTKDGIALIKANELIKLIPDFLNKNNKYFHLLYKGEEKPIAFLNSDTLLNNKQEIIFEGHRAGGDTTWLDYYTDYSAFYFYYDESKIGLRFKEFENIVNVSAKVDTVDYFRHFEKETDYFRGDFAYQYDIENIYREKWLWKIFSSDKENYFDFDFFCLPYSPIKVKVDYESIVWNKKLMNKHNLNFIFNNSLYKNIKADTGKIADFTYDLRTNITSGINHLKIQNIPFRDIDNRIVRPDDIGINYIEIEGKTKPFAYKGIAEFSIRGLSKNSELFVNGFSDKEIYLIDKKNNLFDRKQGMENLSIIASVSNNNSYSTIVVNDTNFTDTIPGFHICVVYPDNPKKYFFKNYLSYSGVLSFLNSIPSGSILTITNNLKEKIPDNIITKLEDLGSKEISKINTKSSWVYSVQTGQANAYENLSDLGFTSIQASYAIDSSDSYFISQNLSADKSYDMIIFDRSAVEIPIINNVNQTDLKNDSNKADAVFIAYKDFVSGAKKLADYRSKTQNIDVKVIDVEDVYKEFNYGIKSPHAIKKLLQYAMENWKKPAPSYLLLFGDADWDARNKLKGSVNIDYIPTYGWPVSDYWYSLLDTGVDYVHDILVGRLPVKNTDELSAVINKLIEYDTIPDQPWMKTFLSLTGGGSEPERTEFKESMEALLQQGWLYSEIGGDTMMVVKRDPKIIGEPEANEIISKIDKGAIWVNFYGHGSPQVLDMDGWHAKYLNNRYKYSFFTTISCNTAAFAEPQGTARNEDYLLAPAKGFIGDGGSSNLGLKIPGLQILTGMLDILSDTSKIQRSFGEIINNAKTPLFSDDPYYIAYLMQYTLLGDPLTKIRIAPKPHFFIMAKDIKITNYINKQIIFDDDKFVKLNATLYNDGPCSHGITKLILYHKFENIQDTLQLTFQDICRFRKFTFDSLIVLNSIGKHYVKLYVQYDTGNKELLYSGDFQVFQNGILSLEPIPYWNMNSKKLRFRIINPLPNSENSDYDFIIKENLFNTEEKIIYKSKPDEIIKKENYIDWIPNIELDTNKNYVFYGKNIDSSNKESQWLRVPFYTSDEDIEKSTIIKFSSPNYKVCSLTNLQIDTNGIRFSKTKKKFNIIAARGVKGSKDTTRFAEVKVDSTFYIVTPHVDNAPVGINIVILSGDDGHYLYSKQFYTYAGENANIDVVNYLNDSVKTGDYLLLAACGSAWRLFYHTSIKDSNAVGSFNSLKKALADYGADLIYQLPDTSDVLYVSYAFVGRKGMNKIAEDINFIGYRIYLSGDLEFEANSGRLETPIIGYARKWNKLRLSGDLNFSDINIKTSVYGINTKKEDSLLIEEDNKSVIDISKIDAKIFPNLRIKLELNRLNKNTNLILNNIELELEPASELALSVKNTYFSSDSIIRGDEQIVKSLIENISLRSKTDSISVLTQVQTNSGQNYYYNKMYEGIGINESKSIFQKINTDNLTKDNIVSISVNSTKTINEKYYFNNIKQLNLNVYKDNIPPRAIVKFDGVEIRDSSYISSKPKIEVFVYDNSKLNFTTNTITFRINLLKQTELNTENFNFELINQDSLKAKLSFIPDSFVDVQNNIEVTYSDLEGNIKTDSYTVFTSINSFILNLTNKPNPFPDETDMIFKFKSPDNTGDMILSIYDLNGYKIRTLRPKFNVGENIIHWNGKDDFGNSLPNGVYFYIINIINGNYVEPQSGKCIKLK